MWRATLPYISFRGRAETERAMREGGPTVDFGERASSFAAVSPFPRKLFVACMMALWLLATQHCGLEAAGLLDSHGAAEQACCSGGEAHCTHDGCEVVEAGGYKVDSGTETLPAPQLVACFGIGALDISAAPPEPPTGILSRREAKRPLDWVASWQFVQRAARLPGAPALISA